MANESLSNVRGLMKNKSTRVVVIITFGVIAGALVYSNMTISNQASRPKDLQATIGAPSMPSVSSTPGTSDNPMHNEKIRELNKSNALEATTTGSSSVPRLSNPAGGPEKDPFDLMQKKDSTAKPGDPVVPSPAAPRVAAAPQPTGPAAASPQVPQAPAVKSAELKENERDMQAAMKGFLDSWTPTPQRVEVEYVGTRNASQTAVGAQAGQSLAAVGGGAGAEQAPSLAKKVAIKAGSILNAVIVTSVNSDEPGPVLAEITTGPYAGGRVIGKFELPKDGQKVMLTFTTLSMQNADKSYDLSAYAVDPETARTALASDVDNHYLARYGAFSAAAFLKGYSQMLSQQGTTQTITVGGGGVSSTTTHPQMSSKDLAISALGVVGSEIAGELKGDLKRPPTVTLKSGTGIGLLVMKDTSF